MPERLNFRGIPVRDPIEIQANLASRKEEVAACLEEGETLRSIETQIVVVKAANDPETLGTFLDNFRKSLLETSAGSKVLIGIVDDSTARVPRREMEEVISQSGVGEPVYLRVQEQNSSTLLGRIRNRILDNTELTEGEKSDRLKAFQYLLSERGKIPKPDDDLNNTSDGYISETYSALGHGHMSTGNMAALTSAYMMGLERTDYTKAIFTHRDDDVFFDTLRFVEDRPQHKSFDSFAERQVLFSDPRTQMTVGKYAGASGSPLSILANTMEVVNGVLSLRRGFIAPNAPTPYTIWNRKTGEFEKLSVQEAFDNLPSIVESALERAPITGFKTKESLRWLSVSNVTFMDQGNYSMTGTLARRFPINTGGLMEYTLPMLLKSVYRDEDISRLIRLETPPFHLRTPRTRGGDTFDGDLTDGAIHPYSVDQKIIEHLLETDDELIFKIQEAYGDFGITTNMLLDHMPKMDTRRARKIGKIKMLRSSIGFRFEDLKRSPHIDQSIFTALQRLLDTSSEEKMASIQQVMDKELMNTNRVECVRKNIHLYLESVKHWPRLFDTAYQLGLEDSKK